MKKKEKVVDLTKKDFFSGPVRGAGEKGEGLEARQRVVREELGKVLARKLECLHREEKLLKESRALSRSIASRKRQRSVSNTASSFLIRKEEEEVSSNPVVMRGEGAEGVRVDHNIDSRWNASHQEDDSDAFKKLSNASSSSLQNIELVNHSNGSSSSSLRKALRWTELGARLRVLIREIVEGKLVLEEGLECIYEGLLLSQTSSDIRPSHCDPLSSIVSILQSLSDSEDVMVSATGLMLTFIMTAMGVQVPSSNAKITPTINAASLESNLSSQEAISPKKAEEVHSAERPNQQSKMTRELTFDFPIAESPVAMESIIPPPSASHPDSFPSSSQQECDCIDLTQDSPVPLSVPTIAIPFEAHSSSHSSSSDGDAYLNGTSSHLPDGLMIYDANIAMVEMGPGRKRKVYGALSDSDNVTRMTRIREEEEKEEEEESPKAAAPVVPETCPQTAVDDRVREMDLQLKPSGTKKSTKTLKSSKTSVVKASEKPNGVLWKTLPQLLQLLEAVEEPDWSLLTAEDIKILGAHCGLKIKGRASMIAVFKRVWESKRGMGSEPKTTLTVQNKQQDEGVTPERLVAFLKAANQSDFYEKIISFTAIDMDKLHRQMTACGLKVTKPALRDMLDEMNVFLSYGILPKEKKGL